MTMPRIAQAWTDAIATLVASAVAGADSAAASAAELLTRYAEPHRHYHTATHIEAVLAHVVRLGAELGVGPRELAELRLAACAHDVVYDANPGVDERESAKWARTHLGAAGVPAASIERVTSLVLLSAEHRADPADVSAGVLLDADLAILAASPTYYDDYVQAVRREYAHVPEELWRVGRSALLRGLLERDRLYLTAPARHTWQDDARANLRRELGQLTVQR
jgi:predicted metal-dependent HD superfamily phosphohydrolase